MSACATVTAGEGQEPRGGSRARAEQAGTQRPGCPLTQQLVLTKSTALLPRSCPDPDPSIAS